MTLEVEHFVCRFGEFAGGADPLDEAVPDKKTTFGDFPLVVVHRHEKRIFGKEGGHG